MLLFISKKIVDNVKWESIGSQGQAATAPQEDDMTGVKEAIIKAIGECWIHCDPQFKADESITALEARRICEACKMSRADMDVTRRLGRQALRAVKAGQTNAALRLCEIARELEADWGDAPVWSPVIATFRRSP